jgi:hypothetical protein
VAVLQTAGELKSDLTVEDVREYKHFEEGEVQDKGAQTTDAKVTVATKFLMVLLNFLQWSVSSVGPPYGTSVTLLPTEILPWILAFFGKFVCPWIKRRTK